jgi:tetratricopeptide (TPR) repeat protein
VEYINAFLYILKGNIFKAVEIYHDLGFLSINYHRDGRFYEDYISFPGDESTRNVICRASILNLYFIFSFFNYENGKSYILNKLLTENCYADKKDRVYYEKCLNKSIDSLLQGREAHALLCFPTGYSIEKEGAKHFYSIILKWMDLPEIISQYYGYNGMQSIGKEMHKLNVLLNGGNEINLANAIKDLCVGKLELFNKKSDASIWYSKGCMLFNLGKYKEGVEYFNKAIECYNKIIEINPEDANAWNNKGLALYNLEKYKEAIECYDKAIEVNPEDAETWYLKDWALLRLGRHEKAFDKAIEIKPDYIEAWYSKGLFLVIEKKYDEALKALDEAIKINPKYVEAWSLKGLTFKMLGKYEEAIKYYDKAVEINPEDGGAWYGKACAYSLLNDKENVLMALQKAIELNTEYYTQIAIKDEDFTKLWDDEDFKRIVS